MGQHEHPKGNALSLLAQLRNKHPRWALFHEGDSYACQIFDPEHHWRVVAQGEGVLMRDAILDALRQVEQREGTDA